MTSKYKYQSRNFNTSKALSKFLRHSELTYLFDYDGTVNMGSTFNELGTDNPTHQQMSPRDFAAMLICNGKQRFQMSVFVNWTWKPCGFPPTQPWDLRIGTVQGHSNKTVDPYTLHHASLLKSHVALVGFSMLPVSADNRQSIETKGLLKNPGRGQGRSGRDSVHFMYQMDTFEWQMAPQFQEPIGIQFTVSWCLMQPLSFNCFFRRME